jgi:hypothetical protein
VSTHVSDPDNTHPACHLRSLLRMKVIIQRRQQIIMARLQPLSLIPHPPDVPRPRRAHVLHEIRIAGEEGVGAYADEVASVALAPRFQAGGTQTVFLRGVEEIRMGFA